MTNSEIKLSPQEISDLFMKLVPDSIRENEKVNSLLEIYMDYMKDSSYLSAYPNEVRDLDFLNYKYEETNDVRYRDAKKEVLDMYLQEIVRTFDNVQSSEVVFNKFKKIYEILDLPVNDIVMDNKLQEVLDSSYINSNKDYKQKKGTAAAFYYIFDLVNKAQLQDVSEGDFLNVLEGTELDPNEPFSYRVESSIYKEVFDEAVKPLAHPLGFDYLFYKLVTAIFEDFYSVEITKKVDVLTHTSYNVENGAKTVIDLLDGGEAIKYEEYDVKGSKNVSILVQYQEEPTLVQIVKDYENKVRFYDFTNIEVSNVKLSDVNDGVIDETSLNTNGSTDYIKYRQYSLNDDRNLLVMFQIFGDSSEEWYYSSIEIDLGGDIPLDNNDKKYYERRTITSEEILERSRAYNGRLIKTLPSTDTLQYNVQVLETIVISDEETTDIEDESIDYFQRELTTVSNGWFIGEPSFDPDRDAYNKYQVIGDTDASFHIGKDFDARTQRYNETFTAQEIANNQDNILYSDGIAMEEYSFVDSYNFDPFGAEVVRALYSIGDTTFTVYETGEVIDVPPIGFSTNINKEDYMSNLCGILSGTDKIWVELTGIKYQITNYGDAMNSSAGEDLMYIDVYEDGVKLNDNGVSKLA